MGKARTPIDSLVADPVAAPVVEVIPEAGGSYTREATGELSLVHRTKAEAEPDEVDATIDFESPTDSQAQE